MEKAQRYKTLRVLNKPLFVWGMNPIQVFVSFFLFALLSLAFQAYGAICLIGIIAFANWSKGQIKKGNYKPMASVIVKIKTPNVITDNGNYYDNL